MVLPELLAAASKRFGVEVASLVMSSERGQVAGQVDRTGQRQDMVGAQPASQSGKCRRVVGVCLVRLIQQAQHDAKVRPGVQGVWMLRAQGFLVLLICLLREGPRLVQV